MWFILFVTSFFRLDANAHSVFATEKLQPAVEEVEGVVEGLVAWQDETNARQDEAEAAVEDMAVRRQESEMCQDEFDHELDEL